MDKLSEILRRIHSHDYGKDWEENNCSLEAEAIIKRELKKAHSAILTLIRDEVVPEKKEMIGGNSAIIVNGQREQYNEAISQTLENLKRWEGNNE